MSGDKKIRVGSRKSELALIQTRHVISILSKLHPEMNFEIVTMNTLGDKVLDIPLPKIGEKSLFTKELETALATGCVDFVVHSLKDLPTTLPEGMAIGAVLEREDPRDALVVKNNCPEKSLSDFKEGSIIGTSSLRRTAQLARFHPKLKVESIRGNLNTRIRKLDELDNFSAIILARAGLCRMGWDNRITKTLNCSEMMYAVGQGALAIECRENDLQTLNLLQNLHCPKTLLRILAERSFLRTLGGGCSAPVAVSSKLTPFEDKLSLSLSGGVWSLDGTIELKDSEKCTVEIKSKIENVCPLGYREDSLNSPEKIPNSPVKFCENCPQKCSPTSKITDPEVTNSISQHSPTSSLDSPEKPCEHCPQNCSSTIKTAESDMNKLNSQDTPDNSSNSPNKPAKCDSTAFISGCPYKISPCKKPKIDDDNSLSDINQISSTSKILSLEDPHKNCPISIPVGLDFMGKCPYFDQDSHQSGKCPVNAEIQSLTGKIEKVTQCPFFKDGKFLGEVGQSSKTQEVNLSNTGQTEKNQLKSSNISSGCPYREPKLYCGIVPSKKIPFWALEQSEHLGKNLAEKLLKSGALEVMQAAQNEIRSSI